MIDVLLFGVWVPIIIVVFSYIATNFYLKNKQAKQKFYTSSKDSSNVEELLYRLGRMEPTLEQAIDRMRVQQEFQEKFLQSAIERVSEEIQKSSYRMDREMRVRARREIREAISQELNQFTAKLQPQPESLWPISPDRADENDNPARLKIVRELSHALYTPLSRIDAITNNVLSTSEVPQIREKMKKTKYAVDVCYTYLLAYRALFQLTSQGTYLNPENLSETLQACCSVYIDASGTNINPVIQAPPKFDQISNYFLLAVTLPLIENAVEACQDGDKFRIVMQHRDDIIYISVRNPLHEPFPRNDVFTEGFTTKDSVDHRQSESRDNEGLGLTVVKTLLSTISDANIAVYPKEDHVTFEITIPASGGK